MLLLIVFIIASLINVILSTLKSVITVKGGRFIACIINAISYGFNTVVIKSITDVDLWLAVVITIASNLVGVYVALTIIRRFEKERLWKITVTVPSENLHELKHDLHDCDIAFITYETSYEKYKVVDIFSNNKNESRTVKTLLAKYKVKYTISANVGTL